MAAKNLQPGWDQPIDWIVNVKDGRPLEYPHTTEPTTLKKSNEKNQSGNISNYLTSSEPERDIYFKTKPGTLQLKSGFTNFLILKISSVVFSSFRILEFFSL